jgi:ATP-dependent protease HslVU (ClpYQ) peptidase subunit
MSCCAVVIDSDGNVHYGAETGLTDRKQFFEDTKKIRELENGDVLLLTGTVRAGEKLVYDLNQNQYEISKVAKDDWFMDKEDESEVEALLVKKDGTVYWIGGPFEMIPLKQPGYFAIGSGGEFAHGVLWHMLSGKKSITSAEAKKALRRAIETACALDDACSLPIVIETLEVA